MSHIPDNIRAEILQRLALAEKEHDVRIVLAVESGSRAWGFASPNSDFDVRFIYAHAPDWYLAVDLEEKRDVIEYAITDDIDLNGWDVRKALRLFWKSNPAFVEWIQSPIEYMESGGFAVKSRELLPQVYSTESGVFHYRSMAKTNYHSHLRSDLVPLKKYLYVLRALLSVRWIERYSVPAPMEFSKLLELLQEERQLLADIESLVNVKRSSLEMGMAAPIHGIKTFIESELERLDRIAPRRTVRAGATPLLNVLFRETVREST